MRRHSLVRTTGVALTLSLSLALAGCGSDEKESQSADNPVAQPDAITGKDEPAATSKKPDSSASSSSAKGSTAAGTITGKQLTDMLAASWKKGGTASVTMESSSGESTSTTNGVVDYTTSPPSMSLTTAVAAMGGQQSKIIVQGGNIYMDMGDVTGGKFMKMPTEGEGSELIDLSQLDPSKAFEQLGGGLKQVKSLGKEKIKGGTFRRYDAMVTTENLAKNLPKEARASLPERVLYSFWFDDSDLVRQVAVDMGKTGTTTMAYDNWGQKVTIKAPAAKDVTQMPAMPSMPAEPQG